VWIEVKITEQSRYGVGDGGDGVIEGSVEKDWVDEGAVEAYEEHAEFMFTNL
jgi:hypothetical protein